MGREKAGAASWLGNRGRNGGKEGREKGRRMSLPVLELDGGDAVDVYLSPPVYHSPVYTAGGALWRVRNTNTNYYGTLSSR